MTPVQKTYGLILLLLLGGYAYLLFEFSTGMLHPEQTVCLFKTATGWACPSCGTTRAFVALLHGEWRQATLMNPLVWPSAAALLLLPLWLAWDGLNRSITFYHFYTRTEQLVRRKPLALVLVLLIASNWCWNIWKGN
jgi:hypothetical protein